MINIETANYRRISKTAARKMYDQGQPFYMIPVKLHPESPCGLLYAVTDFSEPFEKLLNAFCYYNCDNERGKYPAFYVQSGGGKV